MRIQRIFSILIFSGLMIIATTSADAQTNGVVELKKRIFEQIASGTHRQPVDMIVEAETLAAEPLATQSVGILAGFPKKSALLGTWNLTVTFSDGSQVKSTLQVLPGPSDAGGSVIHASELSFTLPNPTLPEQGVWQYAGGTKFIASYRGYAYTDQFAPFGTIGFRHAITMDSNQQGFTGQAVFEVIDATGQVLFSDNVQTRGVRQQAVAP
ncbi:MAG: hypothetical protein V7641_565 [Blastocatellia bacterium]